MMFSDVIEAAERAVADGATRADLDDLARQVDGLDLARPGEEERARLAVLLDFLGLRAEAERILRTAGQGQAAGLRNIEGILVARHGDYGRAVELFAEALPAAPQGSSLRTKILANLAAACLQAGETAQAAEWLTQASQARLVAGDPATDVLLASVQAGVAAIEGDLADLRTSVSTLGEASRSRIAELGPHHPQALMTVANMAAAEFELACAEGSLERQERAIRVLEIATRRLGAELGADHPQALVSLANLRTADLVLARQEGRMRQVTVAAAELEAVSQHLAVILGTDHPQARLVAANVASATPETEQRLGDPAVDWPGTTVSQADLGTLIPLYASASGRVFRVEEFFLPGDSTPLAYLQFTGEHPGRARAVSAAVSFRAQVSPDERAELDKYSAWPRAVVENASGATCGLLMPALPDDYFCQQADPESGQLTWKPREMSWLITTPEQLAAAQLNIPPVGQADRLVLLAQLIYAIGRLHKHGWIFGDLTFGNVAFAVDPPRLMLLNCDGAASRDDLGREQVSAPFWDPPECRDPGNQEFQDTATDSYKLGLAILRCLTPGRGASTARAARRLTGLIDEEGIGLIARALSPNPAQRPTAKEMYNYVHQIVSSRISPPRVAYARLATPYVSRGSEARIDWQLEAATDVTISVGPGPVFEVDVAASVTGCVFRPSESGRVIVTARNRYGSVSLDLGSITVYALPSFAVNLPYLPEIKMPTIGAFDLGPVSALLASASRIGERLSDGLSPNPLDLVDSLMSDLPSIRSLQRLALTGERE